MEWFRTLAAYSYKSEETEGSLTSDADRKLIPMTIEKVVVPKVL